MDDTTTTDRIRGIHGENWLVVSNGKTAFLSWQERSVFTLFRKVTHETLITRTCGSGALKTSCGQSLDFHVRNRHVSSRFGRIKAPSKIYHFLRTALPYRRS